MNFIPLDKLRAKVDATLPDVDGRNWVYPQKISGRFSTSRDILGIVLVGILAILPLLRLNGEPLLLFDVPHRRFVIFGQVFWPHDAWLLFFLLFAFVVAILLITAIWGRAWCGYACPQTVFLHQVFFRIEQWLEGDRNQQMRLDKGPWTTKKVVIKLSKHALFLIFSALVAHIFLSYFMDVKRLTQAILHPSWNYKAPMLFAGFVTLAFYVDFALLREQFCNYICPYARFQSALLDRDSMIVAYDKKRGEPRMQPKTRSARDQAGDCVDCRKCVVVCPQGIDIRDGLQLECIHCARCIDACDSVMEKIGKPRGLIRYASENQLENQAGGWLRPRTLFYSALLLLALGALGWQVANRPRLEHSLLRPPGPLYTTMTTGEIGNHFRLNLLNKDRQEVSVTLTLTAPPAWRLIAPINPVVIAAGSQRTTEVFVVAPAGVRGGESAFTITATSNNGETMTMQGKAILPK